jgi:hypothetical protein
MFITPGKFVSYHAVVPVHEELPDVAFQVKVSPLLCPKTCPTTPSITANNPTHFPSLKTGEAEAAARLWRVAGDGCRVSGVGMLAETPLWRAEDEEVGIRRFRRCEEIQSGRNL